MNNLINIQKNLINIEMWCECELTTLPPLVLDVYLSQEM